MRKNVTTAGRQEEINSTMVDWLEGDDFGVSDIDVVELRQNLMRVFKQCEHEEDRGLAIEIENAFIVRSVARGTASKTLSDVDIVVQFTSDKVGNMNPEFDLATTHVAKCMEDNWQEIATPNMMKWITSIDIIPVKSENLTELVWRFGQDTRTGENFTSEYIYDILEDEYYK